MPPSGPHETQQVVDLATDIPVVVPIVPTHRESTRENLSKTTVTEILGDILSLSKVEKAKLSADEASGVYRHNNEDIQRTIQGIN